MNGMKLMDNNLKEIIEEYDQFIEPLKNHKDGEETDFVMRRDDYIALRNACQQPQSGEWVSVKEPPKYGVPVLVANIDRVVQNRLYYLDADDVEEYGWWQDATDEDIRAPLQEFPYWTLPQPPQEKLSDK